jgi:hypothetical protein
MIAEKVESGQIPFTVAPYSCVLIISRRIMSSELTQLEREALNAAIVYVNRLQHTDQSFYDADFIEAEKRLVEAVEKLPEEKTLISSFAGDV